MCFFSYGFGFCLVVFVCSLAVLVLSLTPGFVFRIGCIWFGLNLLVAMG